MADRLHWCMFGEQTPTPCGALAGHRVGTPEGVTVHLCEAHFQLALAAGLISHPFLGVVLDE